MDSIILSMSAKQLVRRGFTVFAVALWVAAGVASAQMGPRPLVTPGSPVPAPLLIEQGGTVGRELAPLIGHRPVLVCYWRPGDPWAEQAMLNAWNAQQEKAPELVFFPVATLAAAQPLSDLNSRMEALGLSGVFPQRQDSGQVAIILGIRRPPGFALIDVGGVLRAVGGSEVTQSNSQGVTLLDAMVASSQAQPVPTIGYLNPDPVFGMLGQKLPDAPVTEQDGATFRKLSQYMKQGKRLLVFYWSPTCSHCKESLPKLAAWYKGQRPADLVLVDIGRGEPGLRADAIQEVKDYPWVHLLDVDQRAAQMLKVRETPTSFLIDPSGVIKAIRVGGTNIDWSKWIDGGTSQASKAGR